MRNHVRFRSTEFAPADVEPHQVNRERYGYQLATWVASKLSARGYTVDPPIPEDWGWLLGLVNEGKIVRVGCGNVDGSISQWLIWFDVLHTGMFARLFGRQSSSPNAVFGIAAAIHGALQSNTSVDEIEWFCVGARGEELDHATTPV